MSQPVKGAGDSRAAAERVERGIERYGAGNLPGALAEFEEAIRLYSASTRGQKYAGWVRDVQSGKRRVDGGAEGLDEDALRAVDEALDGEPARRAGESTLRGLQPVGAPEAPEADTAYARDRRPTPVPGEEPRPRGATPPPPTLDERGRRLTPPPVTVPTLEEPRARSLTPPPGALDARGRKLTPPPPEEPRARKPTPPPPSTLDGRGRKLTPPPEEPRARTLTPPPPPEPRARTLTPPPAEPRPRKPTPTPTKPIETAPTVQAMQAQSSDRQRRLTPKPSVDEPESPWDPVPLTPHSAAIPPELRAAAGEPSSSTLLGMPPLDSTALPRARSRGATDDRLEPVTREFRSSTPTGPNLHPLDVPELTDEQIQGLLALDSPFLPEGRTTPEIELDRIDLGLDPVDHQLMGLPADALPAPAPPPQVDDHEVSFAGLDFDPPPMTPTSIKPTAPKPVRSPKPEDDPYADLNLLPLEISADLGGPDEVEEGGTNPTNPFIRGPRMAEYTSYGGAGDSKVEELPPLPTLPGARAPRSPLAAAEEALNGGNYSAAVDECERVLGVAGGLTGELAKLFLPLVERIYGSILGGPERMLVHGDATSNLDPRSAFLLSRIDGAMTVEDVLDVSGMPRLEALRGLALLVRRRAVVLK